MAKEQSSGEVTEVLASQSKVLALQGKAAWPSICYVDQERILGLRLKSEAN